MKPIAILETGHPPPELRDSFDDYPARFRALLGEGVATVRYDVQSGRLPEDPTAYQGAIVTGSAAGVYDDLPWIPQLLDWLRAARGRTRLVGICFGHQAMAQAFGGRVVKSPKGWGVGAHDYSVVSREPWMDDSLSVRLPASHQDQVVEKPPGAEVWAASDFTPFAALAYRDQPAISMQPHPEFRPDYAKALIEARRGKVYAEDEANRAVASLGGPDDRARVGRWIANFLAGP